MIDRETFRDIFVGLVSELRCAVAVDSSEGTASRLSTAEAKAAISALVEMEERLDAAASGDLAALQARVRDARLAVPAPEDRSSVLIQAVSGAVSALVLQHGMMVSEAVQCIRDRSWPRPSLVGFIMDGAEREFGDAVGPAIDEATGAVLARAIGKISRDGALAPMEQRFAMANDTRLRIVEDA